ncbi:MAG: RNA polymerase recycling motor HelD [Clostridium sp.]|jgi:DNA helicase II / ATP-dependent DNA helicase PcrA|uniref:RNA polymerase recycling motor HelD n=1 Tax=Clostridium TaxID=1485 RepID=UPI001159858E|nr:MULTISPECIES: RNA polymerase recycling motor HelD [Clostridium]MBS5307016.1 AAA family ATPase [Clostridium sp.]MDB1944920.1 AAA family ATPase [Clostridium tertium]MDB1952570.1 AAA family ATPase [Clostridium tertium]MDU1278540.1 RNA polymerase recycling motor HelD [Clostridium sp.]MDU2461611.1 RNA polymerase recycling motor HelD [Clostridium sp.]
MNSSNYEWNLENEWLQDVLKEVKKQFDKKHNFKERFRKEAIETQKQLWEDVGSVSVTNGLDQIVDFMEFINTMKIQKRRHEFTRKLKEKYEKMLLSPYFARIDFTEEGKELPDKYYIGISNLINDDFDFLVYDWRAPISSMFYDYEVGKAGYTCPEGVINGDLTLKRQYKVNDGKLKYMFDSNLKIDDEILQNILAKSSDSKMKAIVTTIQREQNKIIRNELYKNLIVQGPAGSGKTSVALHRIAYLLYKHREKIGPQNILIFSPNNIFNDYISDVLPQLGEDNMCQTTFKEYMHKALGNEIIKEEYCEMMEYILSSKNEDNYNERIKSIKFKSSKQFLNILKEYVIYLEKMNRDFKDIIFKGALIISSKEIQELYFKDYVNLPLKRRLEKLRDRILYLLEPYEKNRVGEVAEDIKNYGSQNDETEILKQSKSVVKNEIKSIYSEIYRMTDFNIIDIYKELFENLESFSNLIISEYDDEYINEVKFYTLEMIKSKKFNYEDQHALLYLKGALGDILKISEIKYVIIDEAQDYTPLQYEILYKLLNNASITILGDLNQSINPFMNLGSYTNILDIFPKDETCIINLTKSYRSTIEITEFSKKLLSNNVNYECVARRGDKPIVLGFSDENNIKEQLLKDIKTYKEKGYKSIGIITKTIKEAQDVHNFLKDKVKVNALLNDEDEYVNDTLVIPAFLAKGLEFDVVLIYNAGDENYDCEKERLLLYTACTRALHILRIYYLGKCTKLIKED